MHTGPERVWESTINQDLLYSLPAGRAIWYEFLFGSKPQAASMRASEASEQGEASSVKRASEASEQGIRRKLIPPRHPVIISWILNLVKHFLAFYFEKLSIVHCPLYHQQRLTAHNQRTLFAVRL